MKAIELVAAVLLKATGKRRTPQPGDARYLKVFDTANLYIRVWQQEPGVDWVSMYDPSYRIGTVSTSNSYSIDTEEVRKVSSIPGDRVHVVKGDQVFEFTLVAPEQLKAYRGTNTCAQMGDSLRFAREFTADSPEFGGFIEVPVYLRAPLLTNAQSVVPVDDPMWLVAVCAADYARNDIMLKEQYSTLISEANQTMQKMIENNSIQSPTLFSESIPGISDI